MRHPIRQGLWRPLLQMLSATRDRSYVEVTNGEVRFCFGRFHTTVPRQDVARAHPVSWPWYGGIGWRLGGGGIGLIGALDGVVEVDLQDTHQASFFVVPVKFDRLFVSLEDPVAFIADLGAPG